MSDTTEFAPVTPTAMTFVGTFNLIAKTIGTISGSNPIVGVDYAGYQEQGTTYGSFPVAAYGPVFINNFTRSAPYTGATQLDDTQGNGEPYSWVSAVSGFNCSTGKPWSVTCTTQPTGNDTSVTAGIVGSSLSSLWQRASVFSVAQLFATYENELFFGVAPPSWETSSKSTTKPYTYSVGDVGTYAMANTAQNATYPISPALNFDAYMSTPNPGFATFNCTGDNYLSFQAWPTWQNGKLQFIPFTMLGCFASDYAENEAYPAGIIMTGNGNAVWDKNVAPATLGAFANLMNNVEKTYGKAAALSYVTPSYGQYQSIPQWYQGSISWTDGSANTAWISGTHALNGGSGANTYPYQDPLVEVVNSAGTVGSLERFTFSQPWVQALWDAAGCIVECPNVAAWGANEYGIWAPNVPPAADNNGQYTQTQYGANQIVLVNPISKKYCILQLKPTAGDQVSIDFCAAGVANPAANLDNGVYTGQPGYFPLLTPPARPGSIASDGQGKGFLYGAFYDSATGPASYLKLTIGTGQSLATLLS